MISSLFVAMAFGCSDISRSKVNDAQIGLPHSFAELEKKSVDFFWKESNPETGFTKDRAANFKESDTYTVASTASTGFALAGYTIGVKKGWLIRSAAKQRTLKTLQSLWNLAPEEHGWFYHFIDWKTGARMWNCEASTIDTAILLAGIIDADDFWNDKAIHEYRERIQKRIDWHWMLTNNMALPQSKSFSMGWIPEHGFIGARFDSYDELTVLYTEAYGVNPSMSAECWKDIKRPTILFDGMVFVVGGPLFMHEMTSGFFDLKSKRDLVGMDYWLNSAYCAKANRAYCIANPRGFTGYGQNFWGLSACDTPDGYRAPGAPGMGTEEDNGTITPSSAVATVQFIPKMAMDFVSAMMSDHKDALGRFGFSNGVNPTRRWNDPDVIGIDLGMQMLGIDAASDAIVHHATSQDAVVKNGLFRMGFRRSNDKLGDPVIKKR